MHSLKNVIENFITNLTNETLTLVIFTSDIVYGPLNSKSQLFSFVQCYLFVVDFKKKFHRLMINSVFTTLYLVNIINKVLGENHSC